VRDSPNQCVGRTNDLENAADDLAVRQWAIAPDVVNLPLATSFEHCHQPSTVVLDVQPVTNLEAVTVERKQPASHCISDHERDQFLGRLVGAVVIRCPDYQN